MEADNSIRRLMLFLLCGSMVLVLNAFLVISSGTNAFWKNVHQVMVSMIGIM